MHNIAEIPLAIVGMECRLPGADNLDQFWQMLLEKRNGLGELPPRLFDKELQFDPQKGVRTRSYTYEGGVPTEETFPPGMSSLPRSIIDNSSTPHVTLCNVAAAACRNACLDPYALPNRNVGVYIGHTPPNAEAGPIQYARTVEQTAQYLREIGELDQLTSGQTDALIKEIIDSVRDGFTLGDAKTQLRGDAYHAPALISQALGLDGPSMAFDAACASSLRALGHGARALQRGQIDMAIVGGASFCHGDTLVLFSQAQSVGTNGSRPFDDDASGLVAAGGYVVLLLKTLEKAIADGDPVRAVISGLGISSDGRGKSLWAPRQEGQIEAIRRAYNSNISLGELQFLEMHATSTQVGDATELGALANVAADQFPQGKKIPIGSVKANIGHTLETAGVASLVKTVLALNHGVIPPQANVHKLNSNVDWENLPFFVPTEASAWNRPADNVPRKAAVNAFGIGGLNVHIALQEYLPTASYVQAQVNWQAADAEVAKRDRPDDAVAIIGTGAVFPGARTIEALWDMFRDGQDQKSEVPIERWDKSLACHPEGNRLWKVSTGVGGFIDNFEYDWKKHKVPPKQVTNADPLQFMLLDAADQAFHDSGYHEKPFDRTRTGAIVGTIFGGEFFDQLQAGLRLTQFQSRLAKLLAKRGIPAEKIDQICDEYEEILLKHRPALIDETGSFTASTLASRITKTFDLMGGGTAIDSGNSSALAAINCCIDLLVAGDCDMMICAAGQRSLGIATYESFERNNLLSRGEPHSPFDTRATGTVPGEGVGVVILKRLADAQADGDNIQGIIRGIGVARSESLREGIRTAMQRSLKNARLDPDQVSVIEAGADGVPDRDREELLGIADSYGEQSRRNPLQLGVVAGQLGNTGGAAGMASLLKAVSELNHVEMTRTVGLESPIPELKQNASTVVPAVSPSVIPAANADGRLIAGVNSFAQYQVAYHLLVEGATKVPLAAADTFKPPAAVPAIASENVPADLNLLRLSGTAFEIGRQHGAAQAAQIRRVLRRYADLAGTRWDQVASVDEAVRHPEVYFSPAEIEELQGMAAGAGVTVESLIAHNLRLFLDTCAGGTQFAVTAESNPKYGMLHGANEDLSRSPKLQDSLTRTEQVREPADGHAYLTFGVAGQIGSLCGINSEGLAVSTTTLMDDERSAIPSSGRLVTSVIKNILQQADDIDSALNIVRESNSAGCWSIGISHHAADRICYVEHDGQSLKEEPSLPWLVSSNHRLLTHQTGDANARRIPAHSASRYHRLKNLLGGDSPTNISVEQAQAALRDRYDLSVNRERESSNMHTLNRVDNQISIVMQPAESAVWVTGGPNSNGHPQQYTRLSLDELLPIQRQLTPLSLASPSVLNQVGRTRKSNQLRNGNLFHDEA